jgi:hypothetical protein
MNLFHHIYLKSILITAMNHQGLTSGLFPSDFSSKSRFPTMRAIWPANLILCHLIIPVMSGGECNKVLYCAVFSNLLQRLSADYHSFDRPVTGIFPTLAEVAVGGL